MLMSSLHFHVLDFELVLSASQLVSSPDPPPKRKGGLKGGLGTRLLFSLIM